MTRKPSLSRREAALRAGIDEFLPLPVPRGESTGLSSVGEASELTASPVVVSEVVTVPKGSWNPTEQSGMNFRKPEGQTPDGSGRRRAEG